MPGQLLGTNPSGWTVPTGGGFAPATGGGTKLSQLFDFGGRIFDSFLGYTLQKNQQRAGGGYGTGTGLPQGGQIIQTPQGTFQVNADGSLTQIGAAVGSAVGGIGQSLSNFVQANPLLVLAGGAALVLLFMKPPSRRNPRRRRNGRNGKITVRNRRRRHSRRR